MNQKQYNIRIYLLSIMKLLPQRRRRQFYFLLTGMVGVALAETITLGLLSIFATSISSPDAVIESDIYKKILVLLHIVNPLTPERLILILSISVVLAVIGKNVISGIVRYWVVRYGALVQGHIGELLLKKFVTVNYEWHLKQNPHDLLNTLGWRVYVGQLINSSLSIVSNIILVLVMLISIVIVQPLLMPLLIIVLGSVSYFIYRIVRNRIDINARKVVNLSRESNLDGAKTIHGMKDVRIFGLENQFLGSFKNKIFRLSRYLGVQELLSYIPTWLMEAVGFFLLSSTIITMVFFMKLTRLEIFGTLSLLAIAAWRILPATNRIISGMSGIRTNMPFIDNIYQTLDEIDAMNQKHDSAVDIKIVEPQTGEPPDLHFRNALSFNKVYFRYGNARKFALEDVSCEIRKGASIGLIGHSGAGKSTFVDLFIGLLTPTMGTVSIDKSPLHSKMLPGWRRNIGYVPQFPYIYDCSLAENIAFGELLEEIDKDRLEEVCRKASIDFLDELNDGIYSRIGDRGIMISGGQRQRIAIARALYRNPEVLVFDEATSSLDTNSERSIQKTIDGLKGDLTMVIIAHRLTTVENCDYLIWLEKGKLVGIDVPEKIIKRYSKG